MEEKIKSAEREKKIRRRKESRRVVYSREKSRKISERYIKRENI